MIRSGCSNSGTTSAYAENTELIEKSLIPRGNYLRVRGEYFGDPRHTSFGRGTTSAYAENTPPHGGVTYGSRNYLRVRGEYIQLQNFAAGEVELPPRTRRIR